LRGYQNKLKALGDLGEASADRKFLDRGVALLDGADLYLRRTVRIDARTDVHRASNLTGIVVRESGCGSELTIPDVRCEVWFKCKRDFTPILLGRPKPDVNAPDEQPCPKSPRAEMPT
jgi:hypothetical protein